MLRHLEFGLFEILQDYFEKHSSREGPSAKKKGLICLPATITCKQIHSEYIEHCHQLDPGELHSLPLNIKPDLEANMRALFSKSLNLFKQNSQLISDAKFMGYSTFRPFLKDQFPNLRFQQREESLSVGWDVFVG